MSSNTKYNGERISGISKGQTQEAPFGYAFTFNGAQGPSSRQVPAGAYLTQSIRKLTLLPICQHANPPIHQSSNSPIHQFTNPPIHQFTNPPIHQSTHRGKLEACGNSPTHQLTNSLIH